MKNPDDEMEFLNVTDYEKFLRENGLYHEGARKVVITGQMADATGLILALEYDRTLLSIWHTDAWATIWWNI